MSVSSKYGHVTLPGPDWELVANLGDVNPIDFGGYFVYRDKNGIYAPEAELVIAPDDDGRKRWTVYRFILENLCVFGDVQHGPGTMVSNISTEWFWDKLPGIAQSTGMTLEDLIHGLLADDPIGRAWSWKAIGEHEGFDNLDSYPDKYSEAQIGDLLRKRGVIEK